MIEFVNTGNYYFETKNILNLINFIKNDNKANEYYLTDHEKVCHRLYAYFL